MECDIFGQRKMSEIHVRHNCVLTITVYHVQFHFGYLLKPFVRCEISVVRSILNGRKTIWNVRHMF